MKKVKRVVSIIVALVMMTSTFQMQAAGLDYESHWAEAAIAKWSERGLLQGYEDGSFKPDNNITRAEFAQILVNVFGYSGTANLKKYADVSDSAWYNQAVGFLSDASVMHDEGEYFRPNDNLTREEAAYALAKAYMVDYNRGQGFKDDGELSLWAKDSVTSMQAAGYIKGTLEGLFKPADPITRAELVTMIDNMSSDIFTSAGVYTVNVAGNVIVNERDVVLKDMTIGGNLYLASGIGNGDVTLDNIKVNGLTIVSRGGVKAKNSKFNDSIVVSAKNPVRIAIQGEAVKVEAYRGTVVTLTGNFSSVSLLPGTTLKIVDADVGELMIASNTDHSEGSAEVEISESSNVKTLRADGAVNLSGKGRLESAVINSPGVEINISQRPSEIRLADENITVAINGKIEGADSVETVISGGSSSGGSNGGSSTDRPLNDTYAICGTVKYNGEPVESVDVYVYADDGVTSERIVKTKTDSKGSFGSFALKSKSDYYIECRVVDADGYGYFVEAGIEYLSKNMNFDFELQKVPTYNFKITDKNGLHMNQGIKIRKKGVDYLSSTDNYGEADLMMIHEKSVEDDSQFEYSVHNFKEDLVFDEIYVEQKITKIDDLKANVEVTLENIGYEDFIEGKVLYDKTGKPVVDAIVRLYEVEIFGPYSDEYFIRDAVVTDEAGSYKINIPDKNKFYKVESKCQDSNGNHYSTAGVDSRLVKLAGLLSEQTYGLNISAVDKNNKTIGDINLNVHVGDNNYAYYIPNSGRACSIYERSIRPGKVIIEASIAKEPDAFILQEFTINEGEYNNDIKFVFDVVSDDVPIKVILKGNKITIGNREFEADTIHVYSKDWQLKGSRGCDVEKGKEEYTIYIPQQHVKNLSIYASDAQGVPLNSAVMEFNPEDELTYTIDLADGMKYTISGKVTSSAISGTNISLSEAEVNVYKTGGRCEQKIYSCSVSSDGYYEINNLVAGFYTIRTAFEYDGVLYVDIKTVSINNADVIKDIGIGPAAELSVVLTDSSGEAIGGCSGWVSYYSDNEYVEFIFVTDEYGKFTFSDSLPVGTKLSLSYIYDDYYEYADIEFVTTKDGSMTVELTRVD